MYVSPSVEGFCGMAGIYCLTLFERNETFSLAHCLCGCFAYFSFG